MEVHKPEAMAKRIFLISGLCGGIQVAGNQSIKNTIKYLSEFGHDVFVFSFLPENYPGLENPRNVFPNINFYTMPRILSFIFYLGRKIKNSIGKKSKFKETEISTSYTLAQTVRYFEEYNVFGRFSYLILSFALCLPFEILRCLYLYFRYRPDIFYGYEVQGALVSSILGRILGKPVITRFQGTCLITLNDLSTLKNRILSLDSICAMKTPADAIIMANDGTMGDTVLKSLGVDERKICFWVNGLDMADLTLESGFDPEKFKAEMGLHGKKVILMLSKLKLSKRVDRGIYCMYRLFEEYDGKKDVVLLIIGDGTERVKLENLAESLKIKDSVRFLGSKPHVEVAKYYAISDIFLSLYDISNLGNPVLEALYYGLPIVTIDDGSTSHLLRDGYNAFLLKKEGIESGLHLAVKELLENEALREQMGKNASGTFAEKCLSWQERMKLEDALIRRLSNHQA